MLGTSLSLTSPPLAISLVALSLGLLLLLWPRGDAQFLSATRTTCAEYKTMFLELCALVYILCAALSLYARIRARNFRSDVMLVLLREQAITTIWNVDLMACAAIMVAHLTGHHDICDRIHRRVLWFMEQSYHFGSSLCDVFCQILQEPDLERQAMGKRFGNLGRPAQYPANILKTMDPRIGRNQGRTDPSFVNGPDKPNLQERFRYLRSLSMSPDSYSFCQQELRSIGAQLRWSALRDRIYHKPPMQDFLALAALQARVVCKTDKDGMIATGPILQPRPASKKTMPRGHSPRLSSVVLDVVKIHDALVSEIPQPSEQILQLDEPIVSQRSLIPTPVFQLPGTIENICVKALPDTGSSQNVIDKNLVQSLFPSNPILPVSESTDKLLVAPDRQPIPCIGKIFLSWIFKGEKEKHSRWFYVVENCSKGVIIGNGFLRETETMSKHRNRLELTKPSETTSVPGQFLSEGVHEARQDECLRQLVLGRINSTDTLASLDTGCEANLMSIDYAKSLHLVILPLPRSEQRVKYADGRKGSMLGQVEVDWSFFDTPDKATKVTFYVLSTCIHPVILGERFIFSEDPWLYHEASLSDTASETAIVGVVGLVKIRRLFGILGTYKPDPQEEARQMAKKARKDKAIALLQKQLQARSSPQPQQQAQMQPPAVPQPAVVAASNPPNSP